MEGLLVDAGIRHEVGDATYRGELIRGDYAYNLCFRDCVCENFTNFMPDNMHYQQNVGYVLLCEHCGNVLIDHCNFLRGWGPMQTSYCKRVTVRDSVMGRIDNHYGGRDYLIEGCTLVTSHSNINMGFGDGYLTVRDTKFIKTRDYDTILVSPLVHCREDYCAIFSGNITMENIQIEADYNVTALQAAFESNYSFKYRNNDTILPLKLPKVRMRNIWYKQIGSGSSTFTLAEYGASAGASALLYGAIAQNTMIIDGVWSNHPARLLPMLELVQRTGDEDWLIKVVNYDCAVTVEQDSSIDPSEDISIDEALTFLAVDSNLGAATVQETLAYLNS